MAVIQWFPGHMAKARREITEKLKMVDIVIELRDARIPNASKNPMIEEIIGKKPRLIILNKATMADTRETKKWLSALTKENSISLDCDALTGYHMNKVVEYSRRVLKDKIESNERKGIRVTSIRAMIVGIPNVGKSTFINTLSKRKATKTGDKPGVTKGQTWIKINEELQLLDTPGILWPKFEDQETGVKLSICGSIKDEIVDLEYVCLKAIDYMKDLYAPLLQSRYQLDDFSNLAAPEILEMIARKRGAIVKGGHIDYERVQTMVINDIRSNRIGAMTFEKSE